MGRLSSQAMIEHRSNIVLMRIRGYKLREIAETFGVTIYTVCYHLRRARRVERIRKALPVTRWTDETRRRVSEKLKAWHA